MKSISPSTIKRQSQQKPTYHLMINQRYGNVYFSSRLADLLGVDQEIMVRFLMDGDHWYMQKVSESDPKKTDAFQVQRWGPYQVKIYSRHLAKQIYEFFQEYADKGRLYLYVDPKPVPLQEIKALVFHITPGIV